MRGLFYLLLLGLIGCDSGQKETDIYPRPLQILFLGHASRHHHSYEYAPILQREWTREGIHVTYTEDPDDLNEENLALYDGLMLYANHDSIRSEERRVGKECRSGGSEYAEK